MALSLVLIVIGLTKPEESAMAIIGFVFLFLLSFTLINDDLEYEMGTEIIYIYGSNLTVDGEHWIHGGAISPSDNDIRLFHINETKKYQKFTDSNSHTFGYWLAVVSFVGFLLVILGLKGGFRRGD